MNEELFADLSIEPERYEFFAAPPYRFDLGRRDFFKLLGGGILVVCLVEEALAQRARGGGRRGGFGFGQNTPQEIDAWLHIGEDGTVTIYSGKVELGQNIRTTLTQAVAEELRVPLATIRAVLADTDLTPPDAGTFGSRTTPTMVPQLRRAAAAVRELLLDLAAEALPAQRPNLEAADGKITDTQSKKSIPYGQLTKGQKLLKPIANNPPTTPAQQWKVCGQSVLKVNGRASVTGAQKYTSDLNLPGMLHGKVLRPPAFSATLESLDTKAAQAMPNVTVVRDGDFVGVAAPDEQTAERALAAIQAQWKTTPQPAGADLFDLLKKARPRVGEPNATSSRAEGAVENKPASGVREIRQTYTIAYIAHAPLEPRAAVAQWTDEKLTVWTGNQRPFGVRSDLAQAFRLPPNSVRVIVPDTGSGYGGKQSSEAVVEVARLAKAAGRPVKLVWTREEEFTWAYFRPAGVIDVRSAVDDNGKITAWDFHNYNSGASAIRGLYDIPGQTNEFHRSDSPLRQGSYRGLAATANHFARECHIDELAHAVRMDPVEFRLKNLTDPRQRDVLQTAAKAFGWGKTKPDHGRGAGIACGFEKGGYIATCAEVEVDGASGKVSVLRVVSAFDCGAVMNPDHLKNQIEGSIVMGLGGALFEAIQFDNGKILNAKFSRYRVPRFNDVPAFETILVNRPDLPSAGAGETPMVAIAPAVGNAIFHATGVRIRSLPMVPNGRKEA